MILMKDVEGYRVGKTQYASYRDAFLAMKRTGKPVVTLGPNSVYSHERKQWEREVIA
jgi:hypothetical protein